MSQALITIRRATPDDAIQIAAVHDSAWREAYRGLIPGRELEQMIARRGADWWLRAIIEGSRILVLSQRGLIGGYVSYGRNRVRGTEFDGEIFELYLAPEYQGLGFGSRLFEAGRADLAFHGLETVIVWALAENERAIGFYEHLGGKVVRRATENFGAEKRARIALGFPAVKHRPY